MTDFAIKNTKTKTVIRLNFETSVDYPRNELIPYLPDNSLTFITRLNLWLPFTQNNLNDYEYSNTDLLDVINSLTSNNDSETIETYHEILKALPQYKIYAINVYIPSSSQLTLSVNKLTDTDDSIMENDGIIIVPKDIDFDAEQYIRHLTDYYNGDITSVELWTLNNNDEYTYNSNLGFIYDSDDDFSYNNNLENAVKTLSKLNIIDDDNVSHWKQVYASTITITKFKTNN